jgi:hypothetical protein
MITRVDFPLLDQKHAYPLGPLVQLRARHRRTHTSLRIQQREQNMIRRCLAPPSQYLGDELEKAKKKKRWGMKS